MQRRAFLSVPLPVLVSTLPLRAQEAPTFRTETLVVEVPVVVRDRRSKAPVDDLRREDFELRVSGRPVPIE